MIDAGLIEVARWWFKHYPSDIFIDGPVAEIRKQFACIIIHRHQRRKTIVVKRLTPVLDNPGVER